MFEYIKGTLISREIDYVVIDNGGIGYRVFCPHVMSVTGDEYTETILYLHQHVREDQQLLYGFVSQEERRMFRLLIEVTGIGPKAAMGIMSASATKDLILAIIQEDVKSLTRIPGVGPKTAKRLILDLKDKLKAEGFEMGVEDGLFMIPTGNQPGDTSVYNDALDALLSLGFQAGEVDALLKETLAKDDTLTTDQLIKKALQGLNRLT